MPDYTKYIKQPFEIDWLIKQGFEEWGRDYFDDDSYCRGFSKKCGNTDLSIIYNYKSDGDRYYEGLLLIGGEELCGRPLTEKDIELLIEIL